ncbi:MAG: response regulator [Proteobacteria bacterium]|nr:response regulator [Pseudomonadota bacterium]MCP4920412.1 response regulator [Pseudomonadota bacterium]
MRILFVDDEPQNVSSVSRIVQDALDADVVIVTQLDEAVDALHEGSWQLLVTDVFIPLGKKARKLLGPRSRLAEGQDHLGGLLLLDEVDRMATPPKVLVHTACTEHAMVEVLREHGHTRVPKPAPVDVLLRAVLEALDLPTPG